MTPTAPNTTAAAKVSPARSTFAHPWLADQGDGTYCNPILYADYSDPDVIRVGDDFYLTASSFNCTPGLPILHSRDLVNWRLIGHALKNLPHVRYETVQPGCGVWAPSIRFHAGKYWIFFPTPDEGIFVVTAQHPTGPWSEPHCVQAGRGLIDPCPLWDDDGNAYLVHAYAGSRAGIKHRLRVCPMAADGSSLLGEGQIVFHDPERHPTLEGPKLFKKNGWYYILAPAGGVETGWQVALRSKNIYGPYEDKTVLSQDDTDINGPHQGALVDTPGGDWWFLHFQDVGLYGRILHLQPVCWQDGWPMMGHDGEPVLRHNKPVNLPNEEVFAPATSDEFDVPHLGSQWQWQANHRAEWHSLNTRPGWLRLVPQPMARPLAQQPNLLLQKFPARSFQMETQLELAPAGDVEAGLVVAGESCAMVGLRRVGTENQIVFRKGDTLDVVAATKSNRIRFQISVADGGHCSFQFTEGDRSVQLPQTHQASKGRWIGAKIGLYCLNPEPEKTPACADVDFVRFF